jgi:hypothetical protein
MPFLPSRRHLGERVGVIAKSPQLPVVHVDADPMIDCPVPADGRVALGIPAHRRGGSVSLFNAGKVGDGDPLKSWTLTVSSAGTVIRRLSLRQVSYLATDSGGFSLLKVAD